MDNEFPKIDFDIFKFAFEHKCMIRMWFEDYSFNNCFGEPVSNYVLRIDIVKNGLCHSIVIGREALINSEDVNFTIERWLNEALEGIESNSMSIQGRKWE